jgi:hypothetical protein
VKVVKYYSPESWKVLILRNYRFLTLPEQSPAMTEGVEIDAPDVQHKGEAVGSMPHPGTLENIAPNNTASQNAADHLDTPSGPQNRKRRERDGNIHELETSLEEGPSHRLQKQPCVDYQLLDDHLW